MSDPGAAETWRLHKDRIAGLDQEIVQLVKQRVEAEHALAGGRLAHGLPRAELAWQNQVLRAYQSELGPAGTTLALLLLNLRAPG